MQAQGRATQAGDTLATWRQTAAQVENRLATTIQLATQYRTQVVSAERVAAWDRIAAAATAVQGSFREVRAQGEAQFAAIAQQDASRRSRPANAEIARLQAPFLEGIKNLRSQLDGGMALGQRAAQEVYERSRLSIYLTLAAAVLLAVLITWLISRAVVRPLETVMAFVGRVGEGDLSGQLAAGGRDEIGRLSTTLNTMVSGLSDLARTNRAAATADLNAAAAEIRASAQEQAASVEQQFAAVQETPPRSTRSPIRGRRSPSAPPR